MFLLQTAVRLIGLFEELRYIEDFIRNIFRVFLQCYFDITSVKSAFTHSTLLANYLLNVCVCHLVLGSDFINACLPKATIMRANPKQ